MKYSPMTDEEVKSQNLLPPGEYDFEISDAENKTFNSGNQGIKLQLSVFDKDGKRKTVFDNIVFQDNMRWKHHQVCEGIGLLDKYKEKKMGDALDFTGHGGKVKIKVTPAKDGYAEKNEVEKYLPAPKKASGSTDDLKDSIPF